jgi:4Fe-4S binding domain
MNLKPVIISSCIAFILAFSAGLALAHENHSAEDAAVVHSLHEMKEQMAAEGSSEHGGGTASSRGRMLFVLGTIILSGIAGAGILYQRRSLKLTPGQKLNLLDIPCVRRFLKSAWFQPVFQVPVLAVFLVIIWAGLFDIQQGDRNIATLLMWTIWWAAIIFTFVFVGRIWCMMCPFGAMQDWIGRLISMHMDFPRPLRNIYLSSFIFFGLTWWDGYSGIVNRPALTAYLLLAFFGAAIGMAILVIVFMAVNAYILGQPMSMRHTHGSG